MKILFVDTLFHEFRYLLDVLTKFRNIDAIETQYNDEERIGNILKDSCEACVLPIIYPKDILLDLQRYAITANFEKPLLGLVGEKKEELIANNLNGKWWFLSLQDERKTNIYIFKEFCEFVLKNNFKKQGNLYIW